MPKEAIDAHAMIPSFSKTKDFKDLSHRIDETRREMEYCAARLKLLENEYNTFFNCHDMTNELLIHLSNIEMRMSSDTASNLSNVLIHLNINFSVLHPSYVHFFNNNQVLLKYIYFIIYQIHYFWKRPGFISGIILKLTLLVVLYLSQKSPFDITRRVP